MEFPEINWNHRGFNRLLKKIPETGSTDRRHGSGRPKHVRTEENVTAVDELLTYLHNHNIHILQNEKYPGR